MQQDFENLMEKARAFHGDVCPGLVIGTRLTIAAMNALGMDPMKRNRDLIVFVEIDRCVTDAVQAITGCSLGHRSLKYFNYGRFAAVFYNQTSKQAIRVSPVKRPHSSSEDIIQIYRTAPDEELVRLEEVTVDVDPSDLPGKPQRVDECSRCGERIFDNKCVVADGKLTCRACANGAYYTALKK
jgi:formylmethanofuran dehydrogenase subunit E